VKRDKYNNDPEYKARRRQQDKDGHAKNKMEKQKMN